MNDHRRTWPAFRAPLPVFLAVMLPINVLMGFLLATRAAAWTKWTAAAVVLISLITLLRGYATRLTIDSDGVRLRKMTGTIFLPWARIRKFGMYTPGGGVGASEYVYVTTHEEPPTQRWQVDTKTIQVQARPGLVEAIEYAGSKFAK